MDPVKLLFPVVLAQPLSRAAAEPVRITTQMSGQLDATPAILQQMGLGDYEDFPHSPLPFALTIATIVDPDEVELCVANRCDSLPASVTYSFTVNDRTVGFTDPNDSTVFSWSSDGYLHGISYLTVNGVEPVGYFVAIEAWVNGPDGSFGEDPSVPKVLGGKAITGRVNMSMLARDPEIPISWSARGQADSVSVQVSVVPEPAGAGMLAAGLVALALAGRRRA